MNAPEILSRFPFYREASDRFQRVLEATARTVSLRSGDFYFHEGAACTQIALVGAGDIRVFKIGESGREITLYHVGAGETCILTASCVLADIGYPATARVVASTEAVLFPAPDFRDWVSREETLRRFVFGTVAVRMAEVMALVEEIAFRKLDVRLAEFLAAKFKNDGRPVRVIRLTHEQIAAELGSAREVISRLLKDFELAGAISLSRGRITLEDAHGMQQIHRR